MKRKLANIFLCILLFYGVVARINKLSEVGGDVEVYKASVTDYLTGKNTYISTILSFQNEDDPNDRGFSYLPGLIYLNSALYAFHLYTGFDFTLLSKIPVLLSELGIAILLYKELSKKSYAAALVSVSFWLFNPFWIFHNHYTSFDAIAMFFMLLSLYYLERNEGLTYLFFVLSVFTKTFPIILFPIIFFKLKHKKEFIVKSAVFSVLLSLPFLNDINTYLKGTLLVHETRPMMGRPFLFLLSYLFKIELIRMVPTVVYSMTATLFGALLSTFVLLKNKYFDKYILATLTFVLFYAFTPVLNRTYMMWFIPLFLLGSYNLSRKFSKHQNFAFYSLIFVFYAFYGFYLENWTYSLHIWHP